MVKTLRSNAGSMVSIPGWGTKIPHASRTEKQNLKHIVTDLIKTLKMVHMKKILKNGQQSYWN